MAKKQLYFNEAERLYVVEQSTIAEIASRLRLAEKTVRNWKDEGDWEKKRLQLLKEKQRFDEELYVFARKLLENIRKDMENDVKVDPGRLYAFTRLLPLITKVKDYEDNVAAREKAEQDATPKATTADVMRIIEDALGI